MAAAFFAGTGSALAHTPGLTAAATAQGSFLVGFVHPFGGVDHMLAMVAVGLMAAARGGRALWALPTAFVGMMVVGSVLPLAGLTFPWVEPGIIASVIVLGGLVASGQRLPLAGVAALVGLFALFHGHAHGVEGLGALQPAQYILGFAVATALLHGLAIAAGLAVRGTSLLRPAGGVIAASGVILALAV